MTKKVFTKTLSANDTGATGAHQAGMLVPKTETDLLSFLPRLDPEVKNPDAWIQCRDEAGNVWKLRFIYYNNRLHDKNGTRNEYRLTHLTKYLRESGAREGDLFEISRSPGDTFYGIRIVRPDSAPAAAPAEEGVRIRLTSGWRRVH